MLHTRLTIRAVGALAALAALNGCWKEDFAEIPSAVLEFDPKVDAPRGWVVASLPVNLTCPDGEPTEFYIVYPEEAVDSTDPLPAAVLYHSGVFDFVLAPEAASPLEGTHFAEPARLSESWAARQVFTTLGMYPSTAADEVHEGIVAATLAQMGVVTILPANCWGDTWHNVKAYAGNDFSSEFIFRDGRAAAEWSYRVVSDPAFGAALGIELPVPLDPDEVYVVGLGEGGRAVGELLTIDNDEDGAPDYTPAGALVDSVADDLRVFFEDPSLFGNRIAGLNRIFPEGVQGVDHGSLHAAPALPSRFGYLYSQADPNIPPRSHELLLNRLEADNGNAWVYAANGEDHILLNAGDEELTLAAIDYLVNGATPPEPPGAR